MRTKLGYAWSVLRQSAVAWNDDNALRLGAALSYYTVFSIGPLLILVTGLAGLFFGEDAVRGQLSSQFHDIIGADGAKAIEALVASARSRSTSIVAALTGIVALLIAATGAFAELQSALNLIWRAPPRKDSTVTQYLRTRLLSFGLVLAIGFLLLVSLIVNTALSASSDFLSRRLAMPTVVFHCAYLLFSFALIAVLFALIFKVLPDVSIRWRDACTGSLLTAALFTLGKYLIGFYVATSGAANSFGASVAVALLMLWAYYSSLILFFGAEFTKTLSQPAGTDIKSCPPHGAWREGPKMPHRNVG